jgi:putative addiction module CopG family antidote
LQHEKSVSQVPGKLSIALLVRERFVANKMKSGVYDTTGEVVRAGLRTLQREEREIEAKLVALRTAIDDGESSGIARGNVFARVRKSLGLPKSR